VKSKKKSKIQNISVSSAFHFIIQITLIMLTLGIVLLIVFGIVLILLEFFVIPGVTIAGIGGVLLVGGGVMLSYQAFGSEAGNYF
jgi:membrane-bound ClpP family serine protease